MENSLFKFKDYGVFTFISTSQALKAERVLKNASANFLIMPTPREISTSCGLAIKVASADRSSCHEILINNRVEVEAVYQVKAVDGKTHTERINNE
ncbi:MAG: hypothetical protein CVU90_12815 [Firmicutes bacterium HGW-Firmicutes-15]|nr:MAG: hypothetical protein CVU90_12815 [Firmicutes bacterium HGW-Firmicutes-15]